MGVDHNAYIGPYLRVTEVVTKKKIDRCEKHNRPDDAVYCPKCGEKNRFYETETDDAPDDWSYSYKKNGKKCEFNDYLYSTSFMSAPEVTVKNGRRVRTYFYLPNRYHDEMGLPDIEGGKYSEEEVPFDELNIPATLEKFQELFKDEIAYLKQWFEVEVKFGYVSYCS